MKKMKMKCLQQNRKFEDTTAMRYHVEGSSHPSKRVGSVADPTMLNCDY